MHIGGGFGFVMHCLSTPVRHRRPLSTFRYRRIASSLKPGSHGDGMWCQLNVYSTINECLFIGLTSKLRENGYDFDLHKDRFTHFASNHQRRNPDHTRCHIYVNLTEEKKNKTSMHLLRNLMVCFNKGTEEKTLLEPISWKAPKSLRRNSASSLTSPLLDG